jgi:flagellar biosynthesis protein FlhG
VQEPILVEGGFDQADGLRRMFGATRTRLLEVAAGMPGIGRTSLVVNLGAALARSGRNTLLVDLVARPTESRVQAYFGIPAAGAPISSASAFAVADGYGIRTVSHPEWMHSGPLAASAFSVAGRGRAASLHDWVLVNGSGVEPVVTTEDAERDVLILLSGASASITDAYGVLKRMAAADARCRFRVVVNRVNGPEAAQRIFANIAEAAQVYLNVVLEYAGCIPTDAAILRAAAERTSVLDVAPASVAAQAYTRLAEAIATSSSARPMPVALAFDSSIALGAT